MFEWTSGGKLRMRECLTWFTWVGHPCWSWNNICINQSDFQDKIKVMDRVKLRSEVYNILINLLQFIRFFGGGLGLKGQFSQKMKMLSSFTHPHVGPKVFFFFCWTQKKIFWRMWVTKQLSHWLPQYSINEHRIFIFGWTITIRCSHISEI